MIDIGHGRAPECDSFNRLKVTDGSGTLALTKAAIRVPTMDSYYSVLREFFGSLQEFFGLHSSDLTVG
jgi:hypothetical protein